MSAAFWTDARVEKLKRLWRTMRTKDIAAAIGAGCTGNMVIGKAERLGLPRHTRAQWIASCSSGQRAALATRDAETKAGGRA